MPKSASFILKVCVDHKILAGLDIQVQHAQAMKGLQSSLQLRRQAQHAFVHAGLRFLAGLAAKMVLQILTQQMGKVSCFRQLSERQEREAASQAQACLWSNSAPAAPAWSPPCFCCTCTPSPRTCYHVDPCLQEQYHRSLPQEVPCLEEPRNRQSLRWAALLCSWCVAGAAGAARIFAALVHRAPLFEGVSLELSWQPFAEEILPGISVCIVASLQAIKLSKHGPASSSPFGTATGTTLAWERFSPWGIRQMVGGPLAQGLQKLQLCEQCVHGFGTCPF